MKKLIILLSIIALFSCEKQEPVIEKDDCWVCIDQYGTNGPITETKIICDPVEASYQNSKKHYKDQWGNWHNWTCTPK